MKYIRSLLILSIILLFCFCYNSRQYRNNIFPKDNQNIIILYVDDTFTLPQETMIFNAVVSWEEASSHQVKIVPYFKTQRPGRIEKFYNRPYKNNSIFIWNIRATDLPTNMIQRFSSYTGIWDDQGNVLIFTDGPAFYSVVLHEIGHVLGLEHFDEHYATVMHPMAISSCITEIDTKFLCELQGCIPNPECRSYLLSIE